ELGGRQIHRSYLSDERHRDVAGKVDIILAGKVVHLEDLDPQLVHRRDLVVGRKSLEGYGIRRRQRLIVGDGSTSRVGAARKRYGDQARSDNEQATGRTN